MPATFAMLALRYLQIRTPETGRLPLLKSERDVPLLIAHPAPPSCSIAEVGRERRKNQSLITLHAQILAKRVKSYRPRF